VGNDAVQMDRVGHVGFPSDRHARALRRVGLGVGREVEVVQQVANGVSGATKLTGETGGREAKRGENAVHASLTCQGKMNPNPTRRLKLH
jgi:hypothetical protein